MDYRPPAPPNPQRKKTVTIIVHGADFISAIKVLEEKPNDLKEAKGA